MAHGDTVVGSVYTRKAFEPSAGVRVEYNAPLEVEVVDFYTPLAPYDTAKAARTEILGSGSYSIWQWGWKWGDTILDYTGACLVIQTSLGKRFAGSPRIEKIKETFGELGSSCPRQGESVRDFLGQEATSLEAFLSSRGILLAGNKRGELYMNGASDELLRDCLFVNIEVFDRYLLRVNSSYEENAKYFDVNCDASLAAFFWGSRVLVKGVY